MYVRWSEGCCAVLCCGGGGGGGIAVLWLHCGSSSVPRQRCITDEWTWLAGLGGGSRVFDWCTSSQTMPKVNNWRKQRRRTQVSIPAGAERKISSSHDTSPKESVDTHPSNRAYDLTDRKIILIPPLSKKKKPSSSCASDIIPDLQHHS